MLGDEKKEAATSAAAAEPKKKKGKIVPLFIVAFLMAIEGAGVFFVTKMLSHEPTAALGEMSHVNGEHGQGNPDKGDKLVEMELADCKPSNKVSGKLVTFHVRLSVLILSSEVTHAEELIKAGRARIDDTVNFIFRSAEPIHINEPGLGTIKRRIKHELDRLLQDEHLVKEVLITQFLQSGSGV